MSSPWEIYGALTSAVPEGVILTTVNVGVQWTRIINSADGIGMTWTMNVKTRSGISPGVTLDGIPLRKATGLIRGWNLAESSIRQAAINSWYSGPGTVKANGFTLTGQGINWGMVLDPYTTDAAGKRVAVVRHFSLTQKAPGAAREYIRLERSPQSGDYLDSVCEYLLPEYDYMFISDSTSVNKTTSCLAGLSRNVHTVLVGPSIPLNSLLFNHGADTITGFISLNP